jgi:membrane fusion protein, copper/silver efflux system
MKKLNALLTTLSILTLLSAPALLVGCKHNDDNHSGHVHTYTCKHHPEVVQATPGVCPKCNMKLIHKD